MEIKENVPLSSLTTFEIGGPARRIIELVDYDDVQEFSAEFEKKDFFFLGNGSNVLFPDEGFEKTIVRLRGRLADFEFDKNIVKAGGGLFLPRLAHQVAQRGFEGLEWAAGIPGSVGGAIKMNAGARETDILDLVVDITCLDGNGKVKHVSPDNLNYGYRRSGLPDNVLVLQARLKFVSGSAEKINRKKLENLRRRRLTQPVEVPSAGSIFKNPPDKNAGALIEEAGLKGTECGDAKISEKHANFIINRGEARAADVMELIRRARRAVKNKFNIPLETEICIPQKIPVVNGGLQ
ncbi:MAG: UDP-N-acetylmuramate dehydrogenase [bacterium]